MLKVHARSKYSTLETTPLYHQISNMLYLWYCNYIFDCLLLNSVLDLHLRNFEYFVNNNMIIDNDTYTAYTYNITCNSCNSNASARYPFLHSLYQCMHAKDFIRK